MRLRQKTNDNLTDWIYFKIATSDGAPLVRHLSRAVTFSKTSLVRKIVAKRPQLLETHNDEDKTPLMQAIENNELAFVVFLINIGANVNRVAMYTGRSPLMIAVFRGKIDVAQLLVDKGAKVDAVDVNGLNILHHAVDSNLLSSVEFALRHVPVNIKDSKGWTALMRAIMIKCDIRLIKSLLQEGANWDDKDKNGFSCEDHWRMAYRQNAPKEISLFPQQNVLPS